MREGSLISEPYILRTISPSAFHRAVMIKMKYTGGRIILPGKKTSQRHSILRMQIFFPEYFLQQSSPLLFTEQKKTENIEHMFKSDAFSGRLSDWQFFRIIFCDRISFCFPQSKKTNKNRAYISEHRDHILRQDFRLLITEQRKNKTKQKQIRANKK